MTYLLHFFLVALVLLLRHRQIDGQMSPDCDAYLGLAAHRPTRAPYRYRILVPYVSRLFSFAGSPKTVVRAIVSTGNCVFLLAVYLVTLSFGGTAWQALAACLICVGTDALMGTWVIHPWLVDSWAAAFGMLAVLARGEPLAVSFYLLLAALTKEYALVLSAGFLLALDPSLWWTPLPGAFAYLLVNRLSRAAPSGNDRPLAILQSVSTTRRRYWFDWRTMLAGLHATPYLAAVYLPASPLRWPCCLVTLLAWLQLHIAFDRVRLLAAALPYLIPVLAIQVPPGVLSLWVLVTLFWPFHSEWC